MELSRRASLLLPLSLLGCSKDGTAAGTAQAFIDRYYLERDHPRALELSAGAAAERVASEQRLLFEGGPSSGPQPKVYSKLEKTVPRGEDTELTYTLTIDAGGLSLRKRVLVLVKKLEGHYKVAFFSENDLPV